VSMTSSSPSTAISLIESSTNRQTGLAVTDKFNTPEGQPTRNHIEFTVQHEGYWFCVHAEQQGGFAVFRIHAILGKLPFTFQSSFARTSIIDVVRAACKHLKARFRTDDHQRILLIHEIRAKGILNPKIILAETTKVLLQLKPYLQLITVLQPPKQPNETEVEIDFKIDMEDFTVKADTTEETTTEDSA